MNKLSNQIMGGWLCVVVHPIFHEMWRTRRRETDEYAGSGRWGLLEVEGNLHLLERMNIVCGYLAKIFVEHDDVLIRVNGLSHVKELLPLK